MARSWLRPANNQERLIFPEQLRIAFSQDRSTTFLGGVMSIICSDGLPYVQPEVFELEIQERVEHAEDEFWWANYHLEVARNVAQQLREFNARQK
jgi:hypothetical protein